MNILYIANIRLPTEKAHGIQIMKACEAFATQGHELTLLVPRRNTPIHESPFVYYGIKKEFPIKRIATLDIVSWGTFGFTIQSILFALRVRMSLPKYDVLYGRDEIVLAVLALLGVRRIVWESHDGSWNRWARFLAQHLMVMVVVSEGARAVYVERGVSAERILAVPNGIDLSEFSNPEEKQTARTRLGLPHNAQIVMYIGRLDGWKGFDTFLAASTMLLPEILPVVIGGEDEQIKTIRAQYPHIRFLGFRPYRELAHNQSAADVLVVPNTATDPISVTFTSPLKLFAHMASLRPVVASDLPSIREIAGETVYLVEPDNAQALARAIKHVLVDLEDSSRRVHRAQERVAQYSWGNRAVRLEAFLKHQASL